MSEHNCHFCGAFTELHRFVEWRVLFHSEMCATSSEVGSEVIHVQLDGDVEVTEGEDREPMKSSLIRTDPGVG